MSTSELQKSLEKAPLIEEISAAFYLKEGNIKLMVEVFPSATPRTLWHH